MMRSEATQEKIIAPTLSTFFFLPPCPKIRERYFLNNESVFLPSFFLSELFIFSFGVIAYNYATSCFSCAIIELSVLRDIVLLRSGDSRGSSQYVHSLWNCSARGSTSTESLIAVVYVMESFRSSIFLLIFSTRLKSSIAPWSSPALSVWTSKSRLCTSAILFRNNGSRFDPFC